MTTRREVFDGGDPRADLEPEIAAPIAERRTRRHHPPGAPVTARADDVDVAGRR